MIKSMTGYGRGDRVAQGYRVLAEIKAVNHRFGEVVVRMPREYMLFEDVIKKTVLESVSRGRVDVFVTVEKTEQAARTVTLDEELAAQLKSAADSLASRLGLTDTIPLADLLRQPGVVTVSETADDPEELESLFLGAVREAVQSLLTMRFYEGERLAKDLTLRLSKLGELCAVLAARSPIVVEEYKERLESRMREALEGRAFVEEARLLTEVAVFADRASIAEELVRLQSHLEQFSSILLAEEPIGRKLDFLVQEMNREVNTIGSKANDLKIAQHVVEAKSVLEQIREQVQNVE
ncbi:YicC family protein [Tumebacillus sp. DT12]|uniref:YicC family protein n=1 Tax=Tumebacillus lacus TaxID=2995335 RepID=A0ABT3WYN3_9BACL|nr:YicC/YloC family endoribonuclease [Tumebacillus lacus]MCX7568416.1 YicC family protein [Tumebacillus lacus]